MTIRMTMAARANDLAILSDVAGEDGMPEATRERLMGRFREGKLHSLKFAATVWTDGKNKNNYEFPDTELASFASSFVGLPYLRDHAREQAQRGGTILESKLVELAGGRKGIRQVVQAVKPWAIESALDGTADKFSIGWDAEEHLCSVCDTDIVDCKHTPWGLGSKDKETGKVVGIRWKGIEGVETSTVTHPAAPGTTREEVMASLAQLAEARRGGSSLTVSNVMPGHFTIHGIDLINGTGNASDIPSEKSKEDRMREKILALLGLPANTAEPEALSALEARLSQKPGIPKPLCIALGLPESASESEVIGKAVAITAPGAFVPRAEHDKVVEELAKVQAADRVRAALEAGKLTPAMKDWATELAVRDPKAFDSFIENAPRQTPIGKPAPVIDPAKPKPSMSVEESIVARRRGQSAEDWAKSKKEVEDYDARFASVTDSN